MEENQMNNNQMPTEPAKGNFGWAVLGFFIPLAGWILYFVWKNDKPGDANMAGIGGLVGFGVNLLLSMTSLVEFMRQILG